ncbi:MAG: hypothetical protein FRX49_07566 [Trebouxia sp. A1-2]|nr:MAG: hypothetical protein FRX49_07566 [Trebouxia sp. A1-2]
MWVMGARYLIEMTPASRLVAKAQGTLRAHLDHDHRLLVVRFVVLMSNQAPHGATTPDPGSMGTPPPRIDSQNTPVEGGQLDKKRKDYTFWQLRSPVLYRAAQEGEQTQQQAVG